MPVFIALYNRFARAAECLQPLMLVTLRLWMAWVFLSSGLVKIGDFDNTVFLFQEEYQVPLLPPYLAALSGTAFELLCPVLLTLGLATRAATLPLLAMTAVIQFTYDQNIQHYYWAMLLGTILAFGPGKLSLDYLLARKYSAR